MPAVILDRLPLPSLQAYTSISVLLLSCSIYYASKVTSEPYGWDDFKSDSDISHLFQPNITFGQKLHIILMSHAVLRRMYEITYYMIQEPLCIWTLINMAYCCLILLGKVIQKLVFGELRVVEQQHIKDKFWNFVFYKFIFIFGVMNVQYMDEVMLWCSWFTVLGFLNLLIQLCKDRYEYLSFSPTTPTLTHIRLFALLFGIFSAAVGLFAVCVFIGLQTGLNTFCFMSAECTLVTLRTLHVICRYVIHLWDSRHEGVWERRATCSYYSDLIFDLGVLAVDFFHHIHMLLDRGNILLSMASLVICMQLRFLFNELQRRVKRHKNYLQVAKYMELNYPAATQEEIESNSDDCAICWDRMESARKLPCGHLFHTSCLRSWLEQVSTCPTCRLSLITREGNVNSTPDINRNNILGQDDIQPQTPNQTTNHFFHFDGSRYVSWFPSFFVEVSHTSPLGFRQPPPIQTSQLDNMVYQVHQMFPNLPISLITNDLRITRSVELTVENILDGRLVPPTLPVFQGPLSRQGSVQSILTPQDSEAGSSSSSSSSSSSHSSHSSTVSSPSASDTSLCDMIDQSEEQIFKKCENVEPPISSLRSGEGYRFSKSSQEREHMLNQRKEELLKRARSKYISKILIPKDSKMDPRDIASTSSSNLSSQ